MTINSATPGSEWFLNGLANLQRQQEKTQRELSSGYRVHDAADAPAQTPRLVTLSNRLAAFQDWEANLAQVNAEVSGADQVIGSAVSLIETARVLAVRGSNAGLSAADRLSVATQVQSLQGQLVSIANTNVQGRYIFGGDQDGSPPYQLDVTSASGVTSLTAQTATRVVHGPDGDLVFRSSTAAQIFDQAGTSNVFAAVENLRLALVANDQSGVAAALQPLQTASDWLNRQQAVYGATGVHLADLKTSVGNEIVALRTGISDIRDTDIAQAAIDLTRETTSQSAAVAAQAQISRKTLFDYLG